MKRLSEFLAAENRTRFMFELLVPAEKAQLDKLKGDKKTYDVELRLRLMVEAIREFQEAGVDLDVWKVEGLGRREDCDASWRLRGTAAVTGSAASCSAAAKITGKYGTGSRSRCRCRGSSVLRSAAPISGTRWSPGGPGRRREQVVAEIAGRYREFVDLFERGHASTARPL